MIERSRVTNIKKSLGKDLLKMYYNNTLFDEIDKYPIKRKPKNANSLRCCIYKERAMVRYRLMALMGVDVDREDDEFKSLREFAQLSLNRGKPNNDKIISIIDFACASCQQHTYLVTDICRGCEARPCETNCPKDCISIINSKAIIDYNACVSCGKCYKVCPFNSIVYSPVPCEESCPVDAIYRDENTGREIIDYDKCIFCGKCIQSCPFGTIVERSQLFYVAQKIKNKEKPLTALIAPSIIGQFPGSINQIITALKKIGFDYVYEVAYGADITAKHEAEELVEKSKDKDFMIGTSCCPAYIESVKKHVPEFKKFISKSKTPMSYTGELAKKNIPDCITVFIGPCVAKKYEGLNDSDIDFVLTYEELSSFVLAEGLEILDLPEGQFDTDEASIEARHFCMSNGVTETVKSYLNISNPDLKITSHTIDGLSKKGLRVLKNATKGKLSCNIIEVMSCEGGCVAGPGVNVPPSISIRKLQKDLLSKKK